MAGRDVVVTLPWMSVFWLNALPARLCTCWPTPLPSRLPTALPTAFTPLPAAPLMVPSISNVPVSGVVTVSTPGWPDIVNGPRATVKLSCASDISLENGFCGLPDRLRGALASSASRIAVIAIAAGASTTDVPASGCSGGIATSAGRPLLQRRRERPQHVHQQRRADKRRHDDGCAKKYGAKIHEIRWYRLRCS